MRFILLFICLVSYLFSFAQLMSSDIEQIIKGKNLQLGVAALYKDKVFTYANDDRYPLMSVFKFHVAVAALKEMENRGISTDSMLLIRKEQLSENTYSPLKTKYPDEDVLLSYGELLEYSVSLSDNNACDILIDFAGGADKVNDYIKSLGISGFNISETEKDMHDDISNCYKNWATPLSVATLIKTIYEGDILSENKRSFLERIMIMTSTGSDRIKAGLPHGTKFGHKTGTSDRTPDGVSISQGDAGVIYMPDNEKCYIAVFIKNSKEDDRTNAQIMSEVAEAVYKVVYLITYDSSCRLQ